MLRSAPRTSCQLCGNTTCHHCNINNDVADYCVACVDDIGKIYSGRKSEVNAAYSKKRDRGL